MSQNLKMCYIWVSEDWSTSDAVCELRFQIQIQNGKGKTVVKNSAADFRGNARHVHAGSVLIRRFLTNAGIDSIQYILNLVMHH